MSETTKYVLLGLYLAGFVAAFYFGMRFQRRLFKKHIQARIDRAYDRGWQAGHNFVGTIHERRVDMESAVRVLTGNEKERDRPFPNS